MIVKIIAFLVLFPFLELIVTHFLRSIFGFWPTTLFFFFFIIVGLVIAKEQGMSTFWRIRESFSRGALPSDELLNGALILFGAVLLIIPGILTDLAAFILLLPKSRSWLKRYCKKRWQKRYSDPMIIDITNDDED